MITNNHSGALSFPQSVENNLEWIKKMGVEHECSAGMAAHAALMTMTMMDHHKMWTAIIQIQTDLAEIKNALCQSNSSPVPSKVSS